jgi:oxygen-dependent protoporphyrinogen oxidase
MNQGNPDIIIIGAGLTGLSMAYFLNGKGKSVLVLEKEDRIGGVINTVSENGFLFETGPNTGVLSTAEIAGLFRELEGQCSLETAKPGSDKRYILKNGKWKALPSGLLSAISTPLFTFSDKLRILGEPFRKPGNDPDETVAGMVKRRLGQSFLDYAVDPFISGIYAGDPDKLVTRYALPKLYNLEHNYGSFIGGSIKKAREPKSEDEKRATREVFSVKGGLGNLINTLAGKIGKEKIITGAGDVNIKPLDKSYLVSFVGSSGEMIQFKANTVITTAGGYALSSLLPFIPEEQLKPLTGLNYATVVQVALGYKTWKGTKLNAFGGLVPSKEKRDILGVLFPSAIFEGRSPKEGALLSVFLGGVKKPEMIQKSDEEIESVVMSEISSTTTNLNYPDLFRIFRYHNAIPQYEISSGIRFEQIRKIQDQFKGLILAGNIRDGIGMADRVKQAKKVSELLINTK